MRDRIEQIVALPRDAGTLEQLLSIWETAVRATHDFLAESDIVALRPQVETALREIDILLGWRGADGSCAAFLGVQGEMIEMLFVDAAARGGGIGKRLLRHAVDELGARRLDVNEQNAQGVGFYRRMGFVPVGRAARDGQGRPFPLLHLELTDGAEPWELQGDRVRLRRFREDDARAVHAYLSDPEVVRFEPYEPLSEAQCRDFVREAAVSPVFWAICEREEDRPVGQLALTEREQGSFELGYLLHTNWQGRGFAAEAVRLLLGCRFAAGAARRVTANCNPENIPSWRLLERLGFRREGHLRRNVYFSLDERGEPVWQDTYLYAVLAEEWGRVCEPPDVERVLDFLVEAEALKSTPRTAWTATGRRESSAEHSWRLALFCWCLRDAAAEPVDLTRALLLCLVHDLGEVDAGDVSAALYPDQAEKERGERAGIARLAALLPEGLGGELRALWEEYERGESAEARLVRMLDKAETILQHTQGKNEPLVDHRFNLDYGRALFPADGPLARLRALLEERTRRCLEEDHSGR